MTDNTESNWQPIETAPKDSGNVLGGHWSYGQWIWRKYRWVSGRWYIVGSCGTQDRPTHWLPIPDPPEYPDPIAEALNSGDDTYRP